MPRFTPLLNSGYFPLSALHPLAGTCLGNGAERVAVKRVPIYAIHCRIRPLLAGRQPWSRACPALEDGTCPKLWSALATAVRSKSGPPSGSPCRSAIAAGERRVPGRFTRTSKSIERSEPCFSTTGPGWPCVKNGARRQRPLRLPAIRSRHACRGICE